MTMATLFSDCFACLLKSNVLGGGGGNCAVTLREPHSCKAFRRCLSRHLRKAFCVLALIN